MIFSGGKARAAMFCMGRAPLEALNVRQPWQSCWFLTGMYFPIDYLPSYMQQIGRVISMAYASKALQDIMIRNPTLNGLLWPIGTLASTGALLVAIRVLLYNRWVQSEND